MADYAFTDYHFVDYTNGTDSTAGTNGDLMSTPWKTLGYALSNMTTGSCVFFRRGEVEMATAAISITKDHSPDKPGAFSSWPRGPVTCSGNFTAGGLVIDTVTGITITSGGVIARYLLGPDAEQYIIVDASGTTGLYIDPPYKGSTASAQEFTILEDDLYHISSTLGGGDGADLAATWDADAQDMFRFDCSTNSTANLYFNQSVFLHKYCTHFGPAGGNGNLVREVYPRQTSIWKHCYMDTGADNATVFAPYYGPYYIEGCVFKGLNSYDSGQYGLYCFGNTDVTLKNCVVISAGYRGIYQIGGGDLDLINCCVGYNGGFVREAIHQMYAARAKKISGTVLKDCTLTSQTGGGPNYDIYAGSDQADKASWTNYQRTAGDNRIELLGRGTVYVSTEVLRPGGSAYVYKCTMNGFSTGDAVRPASGLSADEYGGTKITDQKFMLTSGTWAIRYYIQCSGVAVDSDHLFMDIVVDDEIVAHSWNGIALRADINDWSQFIYNSGLVLDTDTLVTVKVFNNYYTGLYAQYIDPLPEIEKLA